MGYYLTPAANGVEITKDELLMLVSLAATRYIGMHGLSPYHPLDIELTLAAETIRVIDTEGKMPPESYLFDELRD